MYAVPGEISCGASTLREQTCAPAATPPSVAIAQHCPQPADDMPRGCMRCSQRRGSVRPCAHSGGGGDSSRRARTWCARWSSGGGQAAARSRSPCGRCGAWCHALVTIGAGEDSRSPCLRGACSACVAAARDGSGSAVCPSPGGSVPGCRAGSPPRLRRTAADPVRSVIKWIFDPHLPRSTGFGPERSPFRGPHIHRVDRATGPVQLAAGAELVEDQAVELGPHSGLRPLRKTAMGRRSRRTERRSGQLLPRAARGGHEHDRGVGVVPAAGAGGAFAAAGRWPPPAWRP